MAARFADGFVVVAWRSACLSMGLQRRSWWLSTQPRLLAPDVVVAFLSHVAVSVGTRGAACCGRPRQGSTDWPALALMPPPHAELHISLHLISDGIVGSLSSTVCSVCTTLLVATPPGSVSSLLPLGLLGQLACAVLYVPRRVPSGL